MNERELASVLQAAWPMPEVAPPDRALAAMVEAGRSVAEHRSGRRRMALALAAVMGLAVMAMGLVAPTNARRARNLLISAAGAAANMSIVHSWGILVPTHDSAGLLLSGHDSQESWASPEGWRWDICTPGGELRISRGANVAAGYAWWYDAERRKVMVFSVPADVLREEAARRPARSAHLMDSASMQEHVERADEVSEEEGQVEGMPVLKVTLSSLARPANEDPGEDWRVFAGFDLDEEYYIDPAEGILLGMRGYAFLPSGKTLVWESWSDYGSEIAPGTFDFSPPSGVEVLHADGAGEWGVCDCRRIPWGVPFREPYPSE